MRALRTFKDDFGVVRKNGEEWLIKMTDTETHIPNVYEEVVGVVNITTLNNRQYCVVLDPVDASGQPSQRTLCSDRCTTIYVLTTLRAVVTGVRVVTNRSAAVRSQEVDQGREVILPDARRASRARHSGRICARRERGAHHASVRTIQGRGWLSFIGSIVLTHINWIFSAHNFLVNHV